MLKKLKPLLEAEDVAKINQNIKYDMLVLKRAGVEVKGVVGDSMVADYLLHAGERTHNMDDMSVRYLGHEPIHIEELIGKGKNQKRMDEVDPAQVGEYAAEDADVAYRLCDYLEPQLEEQGQTPLYRPGCGGYNTSSPCPCPDHGTRSAWSGTRKRCGSSRRWSR